MDCSPQRHCATVSNLLPSTICLALVAASFFAASKPALRSLELKMPLMPEAAFSEALRVVAENTGGLREIELIFPGTLERSALQELSSKNVQLEEILCLTHCRTIDLNPEVFVDVIEVFSTLLLWNELNFGFLGSRSRVRKFLSSRMHVPECDIDTYRSGLSKYIMCSIACIELDNERNGQSTSWCCRTWAVQSTALSGMSLCCRP